MAGDSRDSPVSSEADADEAVRSVLEQRGLEQTLEKLGFGKSYSSVHGIHPSFRSPHEHFTVTARCE